jgi:hypothetical protein
MRSTLLSLVVLFFFVAVPPAHGAHGDTDAGCGDLTGTCGVTGEANHFHGVLAVTGESWVLDTSASTDSGCGDCFWSMIPACVTEHAGQPDTLCDGAAAAPTCDRGQILYRLYLSAAAFTDRDEGVLCIGGPHHVVPVGDIAIGDVARYLDNVRPPDLTVSTAPHGATLAGLPTRFSATAPRNLRPAPFGGPDVTEVITIAPDQIRWGWGDGADSDWSAPEETMSHTYRAGGVASGTLATRWHATYTVGYDGRTFGPYDATRELIRTQSFRLPVHTSSPVLVSG